MTGPLTSEFTETLEPLPEQPEPLVRARPVQLAACPGGAKALLRKAARAGLEAHATYALGWVPNNLGTAFSLKHSLLVRILDDDGESLAGAHWIRNVPKELEAEPRYARAEWLRRAIDAYPRWSADWVMFRDMVGLYKMAELNSWLADREASK